MQTGTRQVTQRRFARRALVALGLSLMFAWIMVTGIATVEPTMRTQPEFGPGLISMSNGFRQGTFAGSRECGWPFRSHKYSYGASWTTPPGSSASVNSVDFASGGYIVGWQDKMASWPIVIPYRPLWPGFVVNLLLARAIIFAPALFLALRPFRREFLTRPFHCPTCNYDLRGLPSLTCPECGHSAPAA